MIENQRLKIHSKGKHDAQLLCLTSHNKEKKQGGRAKRTEVFLGNLEHIN